MVVDPHSIRCNVGPLSFLTPMVSACAPATGGWVERHPALTRVTAAGVPMAAVVLAVCAGDSSSTMPLPSAGLLARNRMA